MAVILRNIYLFQEDGEKIFFLIKSKKDEYCFTNLALIHVDGDSAVSSKRSIKRYDYVSYKISGVSIETAGTIDMDVELKFTVDGGEVFSIDVKKHFLESLKDIYKALITISKLQDRNEIARANAVRCLDAVAAMYKVNTIESEEMIVKHYDALLDNLNVTILDRHAGRDFSEVFEKYIHS
jgi:hypothetical protein